MRRFRNLFNDRYLCINTRLGILTAKASGHETSQANVLRTGDADDAIVLSCQSFLKKQRDFDHVMTCRIGHGSLPKPSHLGMQQGLQKSQFHGISEDFPANPSAIRQAVRTKHFPTPTVDELPNDVGPDQDRARQ